MTADNDPRIKLATLRDLGAAGSTSTMSALAPSLSGL
jgi:hypothetical protein